MIDEVGSIALVAAGQTDGEDKLGIRIQPRNIDFPDLDKFAPGSEGPKLDPFAGDLLDRKEKIAVLTGLVGNIDGPCTIGVNAAWGAGKTTFLKMWARHLRQRGFPVVEFNAWETDFTGDPFVSLSSEITEGLAEWDSPTIADRIRETKETAKSVLRWAAPGAIRLASGLIPVIGAEFGTAASSLAEKGLTDYPKATRSIKEFKLELEKLSVSLWEHSENKPLVVFIDELDRCRPSYAIELLETGKHIFSVDRVVFVLAVNRSELAKSTKVLYGDEFDAEGYLKRFFDIDFVLPPPGREQFINGMIVAAGVEEYLSRTNDRFSCNLAQEALEVIRAFFGREESPLSLRTVGQNIHRFGLVLSSLSNNEKGYICTLAVLIVIETVEPSLYRGFVDGELTDEEISDALFTGELYKPLHHTPAGVLVDAVLAAAGVESLDFCIERDDLQTRAPLLFRYKQNKAPNMPEDPSEVRARNHARNVYLMVRRLLGIREMGGTTDHLGFQQSVQRLDLLSPDLLGSIDVR